MNLWEISPLNDSLCRNVQVDSFVNDQFFLLEHLIKLLCLVDSSREPIDDSSSLALRLLEVGSNEADHQVVIYKAAFIEDSLDLLAELSAMRYFVPHHIASPDMAETVPQR